jgi:hypothetical protein
MGSAKPEGSSPKFRQKPEHPPYGGVGLSTWGCNSASGWYGAPSTSVTCYLQDVNPPHNQFQGTVAYPNPGEWSATFPAVPQATYEVVAVGNPDNSRDTSPSFDC